MMNFEKEIICPRCQSAHTDLAAFIYKTLKSKGAGRNLFDGTFIKDKAHDMTEPQKQRLIKRLTPPVEPKTSLPAGTITLTALLLSWLVIGSLIAGRLGKTTYFIISGVFTLAIGIQFFVTFQFIVDDFTKRINKYRKIKTVWNKQYFCNDCQHVFIPTKNDIKIRKRRPF